MYNATVGTYSEFCLYYGCLYNLIMTRGFTTLTKLRTSTHHLLFGLSNFGIYSCYRPQTPYISHGPERRFSGQTSRLACVDLIGRALRSMQVAHTSTRPGTSSNTWINGVYSKTAHVCNSKPVYQKGEEDGDVLFQPSGVPVWMVGTSERLDCYHSCYLRSNANGAVCPESPDSAGCAGEWKELVKGDWRPEPKITVVASDGAGGL